MKAFAILKKGIVDENPAFVQVVGMCPVLAVTTSAVNGAGMGIATTAVLASSNLVVSMIRNFVPDKVRIPCYVVIIASFVTIIQLLLEGFLPALNNALGIFIPLIVVNCIILARAEVFASKNSPALSFIDGVGMGLGFTIALFIIGAIRELIGAGSIIGINILPVDFPRTILMILPPGAFLTLGFLMAGIGYLSSRRKENEV